jgi:hypothetical protein
LLGGLREKHGAGQFFYSFTTCVAPGRARLGEAECVLLTASDAYLRQHKLYIPQDCSASQSEDENRHAFAYMERVFKADITASVDLDLRRLAQRPLGD